MPSARTFCQGIAVERAKKSASRSSLWLMALGSEGLSEAPEFFKVWHVHHVVEVRPDVAKYLGLARGWRFLLAGDFEMFGLILSCSMCKALSLENAPKVHERMNETFPAQEYK